MRSFPGCIGAALALLLCGCEPDAHAIREPAPHATRPAVGVAETRTAISPARVDHVFDGDSLVIVTADGRRLEVRLEGIDAPERGQPFSRRARTELVTLLSGRTVLVEPRKIDRYGRRVVILRLADSTDVGLRMIEKGLAWHYVAYAREQDPDQRWSYARAEEGARRARRGLWQEAEAVPPWSFRASSREGRSSQRGGGAP